MFEITASSNRARVGVFAGLRTPCFFAHSRRGSPAHLTPDNALHCLPPTTVYHASLTDVLVPNAATIERAGGVHTFFNMGAHTMFLSQRDAAENRAFSGGEKTCSVTTSRGVQQVTPASFIKLCDSLRPDFVQLISDEVTPDATSNRCRKSAERTLNWANECLRLNTDTKRAFFFSIQGGGSVQSRNWLCQQASSKPVQGFAIGGLGLGESADVRHNIVDSVLGQLPADKPRFLHGCGQPDRVLDAIARGIDLFDGGFPALATDSHCALVFPIDPFDEAQINVSKEAVTEASLVQTIPTPSTEAESTERPAKRVKLAAVAADDSSSAKPANRPTPHTAPPPSVIGAPAYIARLSCPSYRLDTRPLVPGCTCHTCTNHTRAYLQHLCVTQEMTSNVLLQIHNLHHYSRFFEAARQHVAAGTFDAYRERMMTFVAQPVLVSELTSSAAAAPKSTESVLNKSQADH